MATKNSFFKQLIQLIQNKRQITKGIIRRPLESADGFVSNLYNYELDDGVAKVRLGTKVLNTEGDDMWYKIDSFRMSDMDVLIGINYKRQVWAWLDKWPETNFRVCNSSPFVRYPYKASNGDTSETRQLVFARGNKFWIEEDNLGIIIINDYGDAYRIMRNGGVRIEQDLGENITTRTSNVYKTANVLRLYLDIKNATNKIYEDKFYVSKDNKKKGWRIEGDTRMAYVNDLGVVSELSDPVFLEGHQHVLASSFPIFDLDSEKFSVSVKDLVRDGATASNGCSIYEGQFNAGAGGMQVGATAGNVWDITIPGTEADAEGLLMAVYGDTGFADNDSAVNRIVDIPEGVYLAVKVPSLFYSFDTSNPDCGQYIKLELAAEFGFSTKGLIAQPLSVISTFPGAYKTTTDYIQPTDELGGKLQYSSSQLTLTDPSILSWIKVQETPPTRWRQYAKDVEVLDTGGGTDKKLRFNGLFMQTKKPIKVKTVGARFLFSEKQIYGLEFPQYDGQATLLGREAFDTWTVEGESAISIASDFDTETFSSSPSTTVADFDVAVKATKAEYMAKAKEGYRLALWNSDYIVAVGQRFIYNSANNDIVYETEEIDTGYYGFTSNMQNYRLGTSQVIAMDNTGLRRKSLPLPLVRRAMRNPQYVAIAGGNLYVVEDSKLWFGPSSELMLTNEIELQGGVFGIAPFGQGVVASTKSGLIYMSEGKYDKVQNSDGIVATFIAPCSGGCIAVEDRDVYLVYKQVTESGAWYPTVTEIGTPISEVNFIGSLKSVSIGDKIYLADDWNVWIFDLATKAWSGVFNYDAKIQQIFRFNNKLGLAFDSDIDKRNSFDTPLEGSS